MTSDLLKRVDVPFELYEVDLFSSDTEDMMDIVDRMGLNLSKEEMLMIRVHFREKDRNPTDVELQSIAQAWSEHCCYKSSKVFLKEHLFDIDHPDVLAKGDAGVMSFDQDHGYALRIESHNHPSAIEPYGGAATGIGGIIRDVLCMGAQPVALIDPLFFGPLDYQQELPPGVKHPRYLMDGVVSGIRDYGNRVGIPTVCGGVFFDEGYIGNCLVNVGCVGIVPKDDLVKNAVGAADDLLILVGGKTGRDGIHGVTFASAQLDDSSEEEHIGAVQLGDPIMKEPLIHACLEVNRRGLISGMKDLGGGGLSCVVGEMALEGGYGATVDLSKVPLKEEGLAPWEIWVSESQERMMLSAPEENLEEVMEVFDIWDVPATVVGSAMEEKMVRLEYQGKEVFELSIEFLTQGPEYCRACVVKRPREVEEVTPELPEDMNEVLLTLLSDHNIASKDWVIRQYDQEVRASTVIKPLQGKLGYRSHGDASVIKPLEDSNRGLAITVGVNPWFTSLDPFRGGQSAVDEVCRNLISVGAFPHSLTDCLNFGNPEKPDRLGEFKEAVRGIGEVARAMNLPLPSGNVSLYNETPQQSVTPTPTVMGVGIVHDISDCVTVDMKRSGNPVYIVGVTKKEMGGSALYRSHGGRGGVVPSVDKDSLPIYRDELLEAIGQGLVNSCHDCSDGGLSVALAEMCIAGDLGFEGDPPPADVRPWVNLFSESNTRWVVEVPQKREGEWNESLTVPHIKLGETGGDRMIIGDLIDLTLEKIRETWSAPLRRTLG